MAKSPPALKSWARATLGGGTEFKSQKALQSYLSAHPNADASKHSVAEAAKPQEGATRAPVAERAAQHSENMKKLGDILAQRKAERHATRAANEASEAVRNTSDPKQKLDAHRKAEIAHRTAMESASNQEDKARHARAANTHREEAGKLSGHWSDLRQAEQRQQNINKTMQDVESRRRMRP